MTAHEVEFRQAPGWRASLVQAVCSCGWRGPVRHAGRDRAALMADKGEHTRGDCAHCGGSGFCPYLACSPCWHPSTACRMCGGTGWRAGGAR